MKKVYFNEYNIPMENTIYFPYASGLLRAYAETYQEIKNNYEFMPFIFKRDTAENIVAQHVNPDIVCFSVSIWNYNLSYKVAIELKKKFPSCKIIFGGPSAPTYRLPFIDFIINGPGEFVFTSLLLGRKVLVKDINDIPSPYLSGLFDYLLGDDIKYQAIVETNRGCPFECTYCYWGKNIQKMQFFSEERILREANWMGENQISYIFCADANFGTFTRDKKIAEYYKNINGFYSYPHRVRVCYGKTNQENILETARILHSSDLAKAVTLSMQSMNPEVIKNIKRTNMSVDEFDMWQNVYAGAGIPTYTELILGLPEETKESFIAGVNHIIQFSNNNNLFIYHCSILPNTLMAEKEYQKQHGIKTVKIPISEVHCKVRPDNLVQEYDEIVIETNAMSMLEWIELATYSWGMQLKHSLNYNKNLTNKQYEWLRDIAVGITEGKQRCVEHKGIYWEPEEALFLNIYQDVPNIEQKLLHGRKGNEILTT